MKYAFIEVHRPYFSITAMCRVLCVHKSGFYAWLQNKVTARAKEDERLTGMIKQSWLESGKVYGYRKLHADLRAVGESCGKHKVARLCGLAGIKAQTGYKRKPGKYGGKPSVVAINHLQQSFDVDVPDTVWVTDITYIKTHEGWLYLCVVIDLFSRKVIGWSMQDRMHMDIVLSALLMAVKRRRPTHQVIIHSDQGSQFTSHDWQSFLKKHNMVASMSRSGNCYDNAVAESFFHLLKRERIRRKVYATRKDARDDIFDYIEFFYNPKRKHGSNHMLSPVEFEKQHKGKQQSV